MQMIVAALLAGVIATPHCAGMCGGFAVACARSDGAARRSSALPVLATGLWSWHAGRLTTYALLGALAGAFGGVLPGPAWLPGVVSAALLVWFAAALAGLLPQLPARFAGLARAGQLIARRPDVRARFAFGLLNGLLPCGMVYAALSLALATAHPAHGALAMAAFGTATVPGLTVVGAGAARIAGRSLRARRALAAVVLALGLWSVSVRAFHFPAPGHADPAHDAAHAH